MRNHNNHSMETTATTDHDACPARREPGTGNRRRVLAAFVLAGAALLGFGTNAQAQTRRPGHTDESHGHDEQQDTDRPLLDGADEERRHRHFDYRLQDRIFRPGLPDIAT